MSRKPSERSDAKDYHKESLVLAARCDAHGKSDADIRIIIKALQEVLAERRVAKNGHPIVPKKREG